MIVEVKLYDEALGTVEWNDVQNIFPIPQADMDVNTNLIQNPGF